MQALFVRKSSFILVVVAAVSLFFSNVFGIQVDAAVQTQGQQVVTYAQNLKGSPFKMGGTTPKGFDASGFTQYVYKKSINVNLNRTSADQFKQGTSVKMNELKPGDLVFYKTNGKTVSFVAIYIGKDQFIGATSKGVQVQSMNLDYWKKHYVGAKRIVK